MEIGQVRTKVKLLKSLDDLGYKFSKNVSFKELEKVIPIYTGAKLKKIISDFVLIPGEIGTSKHYQIYIKKRPKSIFERNRERNKSTLKENYLSCMKRNRERIENSGGYNGEEGREF